MLLAGGASSPERDHLSQRRGVDPRRANRLRRRARRRWRSPRELRDLDGLRTTSRGDRPDRPPPWLSSPAACAVGPVQSLDGRRRPRGTCASAVVRADCAAAGSSLAAGPQSFSSALRGRSTFCTRPGPTAPDGLYAGYVNIWGDWAAHLSFAGSFAYGHNFPPRVPDRPGQPPRLSLHDRLPRRQPRSARRATDRIRWS